jgi:hypothetical protein
VKTVGLESDARARLHLSAEGRQIDYARTSILFSALAAAAYVNASLAEALSPADFEGIDRLTPVDKYILGPRIAYGEELFTRGDEPGQSIAELFKLRNQLVHAKPRTLEVDRQTLSDPRYTDFNPPAAARFLVAVAEAAGLLAQVGNEIPDQVVTSIRENAGQFRDFGESLREKLPEPDERTTTAVRRRRPPVEPVESAVPRSPVELAAYLGSLAGTASPAPREGDGTSTRGAA